MGPTQYDEMCNFYIMYFVSRNDYSKLNKDGLGQCWNDNSIRWDQDTSGNVPVDVNYFEGFNYKEKTSAF